MHYANHMNLWNQWNLSRKSAEKNNLCRWWYWKTRLTLSSLWMMKMRIEDEDEDERNAIIVFQFWLMIRADSTPILNCNWNWKRSNTNLCHQLSLFYFITSKRSYAYLSKFQNFFNMSSSLVIVVLDCGKSLPGRLCWIKTMRSWR